jgi:hypothetical protein
MAVAANEPYSRVSQENGVFDGGLIGMAIGAGGAGAGVFGARMSHNGIEKKATNAIQEMDGNLANLADKETSAINKYDKKIDKQVNRESTKNTRLANFKNRRIDKNLDKIDSRHQKNLGRINTRMDNVVDEFAEVSRPDYVKTKQASHAYSKHMGGWKNAAIIGASAVVSGGIGMLADKIHD